VCDLVLPFETDPSFRERIEGVHHAFSRSPLVFGDDTVVHTGDSLEEGYERSLDYFADWNGEVTGVTCYNDLVALEVMKGLRERRLSVPDDVSIIGFDDLKLLDYFPILLTPIQVPTYEMGRRATKLLLDQIDSGTDGSAEQIELNAELVVRSSTAPPSEKR
jgi:LacI family transcriptional regulator